MSEMDQEYHKSYKPSWGPGATLLYAMPSKVKLPEKNSTQIRAIINDQNGTFVSEGRDIRFAKFVITPEVSTREVYRRFEPRKTGTNIIFSLFLQH